MLDNLRPPLNEHVLIRILESINNIQIRLQSIPVDDTKFHFAQSQTFTDGRHTIVLKGQLHQPTLAQRLLGIFR